MEEEVPMATILDGKAHADRMLESVRLGVEDRKARGLRAPGLAVVLVGDDPRPATSM